MSSLGSDILALVRTPSVTGEERALADALEVRLRNGPAARGHRLVRFGDSLLLAPDTGGSDPRPLIVLSGHIDTVPPDETLEPALRDGKVFGRGACDMKAGVAVMVALAEQVPAQAGFAARAFVFYTGEEGPATGNALGPILEDQPWLRRAKLGILLEPTGGALELGCSGSIHIGITFHGRACHSARPWTGEHPLRSALPWLEKTLRRPVRDVEVGGVVFREVVSLTTVHAGQARNMIPGTLVANLNVRYAPTRTPEEGVRFALSFCPGASGASAGRTTPSPASGGPEGADPAQTDDASGVEAVLLDHSPPGRIDLEAPLYRHLCETTGLPRRAKQGWTDVARLTAAGIPALNWGPGNPELAHTREEHVEIEEAERCLEQMRAFLLGAGPADGA